jgi:hypothetical protein
MVSFAEKLDAVLAMLHEEPEQLNGETKPIDRLQLPDQASPTQTPIQRARQ